MSDELIHRGGATFSRFAIEQALLDIPGVRVGHAVAFDNTHHGEEIGAYIVVETGMHLSEEKVLDYCRTRLGDEQSPKVVVFGKAPPVTTAGEYERARLKRLFERWRDVEFKR